MTAIPILPILILSILPILLLILITTTVTTAIAATLRHDWLLRVGQKNTSAAAAGALPGTKKTSTAAERHREKRR